MTDHKFRVRHGERRDCAAIAGLIKELALYEKMADQAKLTVTGKPFYLSLPTFPSINSIQSNVLVTDLERDGFDSNSPYFHCIVAECVPLPGSASVTDQSVVVGFALYFYAYSTWEGKEIGRASCRERV